MASLPVRLTRAASKLGMLRRGYADEAANAFSLTFATPAKVCLTYVTVNNLSYTDINYYCTVFHKLMVTTSI